MKTVLAIRHIHFENLGILAAELERLDFSITVVDAPTVDFSTLDTLAYDLVIVLGAPIGAFDEDDYPFLQQELVLVQQRIEADKPLLGICLGAQLIARALGADVYAMTHKEIGFGKLALATTPSSADNVLQPLENVPVLHWHGDQFDIPKGSVALAATKWCPNQAFTYGKNILALQFHMEAEPKLIEQWLVGHACELGAADIDKSLLRKDAIKYRDSLVEAGRKTFGNWIAAVGLAE